MKKQLTALALLFGSLAFLNAAAPVLQKDGSLELDGWRGTPTTFSQSWHAWQPRKAPRIFRPVKSSNERVEFYLELPDAGSGGLSFALADGKFEGILDLRQGTLIRTICLQTPLPVSLYAGNKLEIDGKLHEFPIEFGKATIFDGTAKRVRIPSKTGEILFEGNFHFRIQDGRKWNGSTFGMRIGFLPHDGKVSKAKLAFTIRHGKAGEFGEKLGSVSRPPYSAKQNAEWKAFEYSRSVKPGSALDFSARLDAPAGKYGPIVPDGNGHFAFRDRPGTPVRFYGPNFVGDSQRPTDEVAHELAERIAAFGFNAVRIHHHDNEIYARNSADGSLLDPKRMERLDYLLATLKKRGIYYTTDVYVSRRNIPAAEIPGVGAIQTPQEYKALFYIDDRVYENWLRWAKEFLGHVNPYTGLALKDDPALITLSLVNEANPAHVWNATPTSGRLYKERFAQWRETHPGKNFDHFLSKLAISRYEQMKRDLRAFGVKTLLTDQNFLDRLALAEARSLYDFVDNHAYWDHPRFAGKAWSLPVIPNQRNAVAAASNVPAATFPTRLFGKPFTVSEFDYANPNQFRAAGPALAAAAAAFQDWDALFPFAYAHSNGSVSDPNRTDGFFDIATDPVKAFSQRIGANLFLSGGISPAKSAFAGIMTDPLRKGGGAEAPEAFVELGYLARTGGITTLSGENKFNALVDLGTGNGNGTKLPVFKADKSLIPNLIAAGLLPEGCHDAASGRFTAPGGELEINHKAETFRAAAPGGEVLVTGKVRALDGNLLHVKASSGFSVFGLLPVDTAELRSAERLTLFHLTNTQATGMRFGNASLDRLENWGETPFLAKHGTASVVLNLPGNWKIHALDTAGNRIGEVTVLKTEHGFRVELDNFRFKGVVFAYELVKE